MSEEAAITSPDSAQGSIRAAKSHPLDQLSFSETRTAREIILNARGPSVIEFRSIALEEPPKAELLAFLDVEHKGFLDSQTRRPARVARVKYDLVHADRSHDYIESLVDLDRNKETLHRVVDKIHQPSLTMFVQFCIESRKAQC